MFPLPFSLALTLLGLLSSPPQTFLASQSSSSLVHAVREREPWKRQASSGNASSPSVNTTGKAVWVLEDTYEGQTFFEYVRHALLQYYVF